MNEIESIIARLEQQRTAIEKGIAALREISGQGTATKRLPGRPKGSGKAKKRTMSSDGRQRQIEAMRRYWAAKKAAAKKSGA